MHNKVKCQPTSILRRHHTTKSKYIAHYICETPVVHCPVGLFNPSHEIGVRRKHITCYIIDSIDIPKVCGPIIDGQEINSGVGMQAYAIAQLVIGHRYKGLSGRPSFRLPQN
jgi:hypothetical protein